MCIRKEERLKINDLCMFFRNLENNSKLILKILEEGNFKDKIRI